MSGLSRILPRALLRVLWLGVAVCTASGDDRSPAPLPTRWMAPAGIERMPHEVWEPNGPFVVDESRWGPAPGTRSAGRVAVIVEFALEPVIGAAIDRYAADLAVKGCTPLVSVVSGGTPGDLRAYLTDLYNEPDGLIGAIFAGNLPYIVYEMEQSWTDAREYEDFPCDIYFMDMTGTWLDDGAGGTVPAGNGKYDHWVDQPHQLEIWIGRMRVDTLAPLGSPPAILNRYFARNHLYRTGRLVPPSPPQRALAYVDDDWGNMVPGHGGDAWCLEQVYDDVTCVYDDGSDPGNNATAADYRAVHMPAGYQMIHVRSHGSPGAHGFYQNYGMNFEWVFSSHYMSIDPPAQFYSLFVCSGCDYTGQYGGTSTYLGGIATFNEQAGLAAWGSTKTGGMWNDPDFYSVLGRGECLGSAFVQWFNISHAVWPDYAPRWWYGMVLIGDAALVPNGDYFAPNPPQGLVAIEDPEGVALSWQANGEPDLARYDVYRREGLQPGLCIASVDAPATGWMDGEVLGGHTYTYWITAIDALGNESGPSALATLTWGTLSAAGLENLPRSPTLASMPGPAGAGTIFALTLPIAQRAGLVVHDALGRRVRLLLDRALPAGAHVVRWDGRDDAGRAAPAGIYFGRLQAGGTEVLTRSVLQIR